MAAVTGSVQAFNFAGGGTTPSAQNATIPSDTKAVVVKIEGWAGSGTWTVATLKLGGRDFAIAGIPHSGDMSGVYTAVMIGPPTGTVALQPTFGQTPESGPVCLLVCLSADGSIITIDRDHDQAGTPGSTLNLSVASNTGDFVGGRLRGAEIRAVARRERLESRAQADHEVPGIGRYG
jgi:hypothetical protein